MIAMYKEVGRYAHDLMLWPFASKPRWLSLLGPSETGKTHLARCLYDFWREHGEDRRVPMPEGGSELHTRTGRIVRFGEVLDAVLGHQKQPGWIRTIMEADFLVIDDIGTENDTAASKDILYRLLDARTGSGLKPPMWTVLTSNLLLEDITTRYDARLSSRMRRHGSTIVELPIDLTPYHDR